MTPTFCTSASSQKIKVFNFENLREPLKDIDGSLARLQEFVKNINNYITTKIKNTKVLLFTQLKENKESVKKDINLWTTDGNRTTKVDNLFSCIKNNIDISMLYTNEKLFALHKKYNHGEGTLEENTFSLTLFNEQLTNTSNILEAYKNSHDNIEKLCKNTDLKTVPCSTDGLVGFLFNDGENNKYWKDEYLHVNAKVTNDTKADDGFKFSGAGAGAVWPVGKEKEDQPYNFADPGFTLVAL